MHDIPWLAPQELDETFAMKEILYNHNVKKIDPANPGQLGKFIILKNILSLHSVIQRTLTLGGVSLYH